MLVLTLTMLAGCGDKDESDKKKKDKTPSVVKGSMEEMLDAMAETNSGTARIALGAGAQTVAIDFSFDRESHDLSVAVKATVKGKEIQNDFFITKDNVEYIHLEAMLDVIAAMDASGNVPEEVKNIFKGWIALPLPKELPSLLFADKNAIFTNLFTKLAKGLKAEGSDGDYTITVKTKDDYRKFLEIAKEYADNDLRKDLTSGEGLKAVAKIDYNAYVKDLIAFYEDDLYAIVREQGSRAGITEEQLKTFLDEAKKQDFNAMVKQQLENTDDHSDDIEGFLMSFADDFSEMIAKSQEDLETTETFPEAALRVSADDTGYTVELSIASLVKSGDSENSGDTKVTFRLVPGNADVSKPADVASVKTLADMLAPSFLRYVEKSRTTSDRMFIEEMIHCTEVMVCDPGYGIATGTRCVIEVDNGSVKFSAKDASGAELADFVKDWNGFCETSDRQFKSMELSMAKGRLVGTVSDSGGIVWTKEDLNSAFESFLRTNAGTLASYFREE